MANKHFLGGLDNEWGDFKNSLAMYDAWAKGNILYNKILKKDLYKGYSYEGTISELHEKSLKALNSLKFDGFKIEQKMSYTITLNDMVNISNYIKHVYADFEGSQETDFLNFLKLEEKREDLLLKLQSFDELARSILEDENY